MDLLARTGVGRDINRHYYAAEEVREHLERPVVRRHLELIRFRNRHGAFNGSFEVASSPDKRLVLEWRDGAEWARLEVDLASLTAMISYSTPQGTQTLDVTSLGAASKSAQGEVR